jgi:hypothetical protein
LSLVLLWGLVLGAWCFALLPALEFDAQANWF